MNYERLYTYRFRDVDQAARERVWSVIARDVHERMGRPATVLDPAAGRGEFISQVPATDRWAVDFVDQPGRIADAGVRWQFADMMEAELPAAHFEGVYLSNILEHLLTQEAVAALLERLRAAMVPGGRIAIMGPNFRYAQREYFDFADHTLIFTHHAIVEHLAAAGFTPTTVIPRFLPFTFTGRLPPSPALTRRYLRMPAAWRVLGKQFFVVGTA